MADIAIPPTQGQVSTKAWWLIVDGDPMRGATCHEVEVVSTDGEPVRNANGDELPSITVQVPEHTDWNNLEAVSAEYLPDNWNPMKYNATTVEGLLEDELIEIDCREDAESQPGDIALNYPGDLYVSITGRCKCKLVEKDPTFAEGTHSLVPGSYDDMVDMKKLNDAELMRNLRTRFEAFAPFARCGITLVSMNTYMWPGKDGGKFDYLFEESSPHYDMLSNLYSEEKKELYLHMTDRNSMPPHAWALASQCYNRVLDQVSGVK